MRHWVRFFSAAVCVILLLSPLSALSETQGDAAYWDYPEYAEDVRAEEILEQIIAAIRDAALREEEEAKQLSPEEAERAAKAAEMRQKYMHQAPKQITISFVGDCTLGNTPLQREYYYDVSFENYIETYGMEYPFENVKEILLSDDLTVANLEGVFYDYEANRANKTYNFRSITDYVDILTLAGIDAVSIGNNHSMDYGDKGEASTIQTLQDARIGWFGVNEAANGTYIFEKDGVKFGFMSVYYSFWAKGGRDAEKVKKNLADLQAAHCDVIIAGMHCGVEYDPKHDDNQEKMARWLYKYGADLVIGHHPHSIQGITVKDGHTTLWSLGNFVFGGNPSLNYKNPIANGVLNIESYIAQITFSFDENNQYLGHQLNIIPCFMSGTKEFNNYQPVLVTGDNAQRVIDAIQLDSRPLKINPYIDGVGAIQEFVPAAAK